MRGVLAGRTHCVRNVRVVLKVARGVCARKQLAGVVLGGRHVRRLLQTESVGCLQTCQSVMRWTT